MNESGDEKQEKVITPPIVKAISGSLGGAAEACCMQPMDSIKTRLQLDTRGQYKGILGCAKSMVSQEGPKALWKGLTPYSTHLILKHTLRMGSNALLQSLFRDPHTGDLRNSHKIISGFGAGILEALLIVTPCEVVKIRLQQQRGVLPSASPQCLLYYKGPIHCASRIVHEEGAMRLWAGATPTMMRNGINQAIMFTSKSYFDAFLWGKRDGNDAFALHPLQSMISGFFAGFIGPICTGPFDVVKTRLMAQKRGQSPCYKGMFDALFGIYKMEGLCALWKGLLPRVLKIPPGQAIMWMVADQVVGFYENKLRRIC